MVCLRAKTSAAFRLSLCGLWLAAAAIAAHAQSPSAPSAESSAPSASDAAGKAAKAAPAPLAPPSGFKAFDIPGDRGGAVGLSWDASAADAPGREYILYKSTSPGGPFEEFKRFPATKNYQSDEPRVFGYSASNAKRHFIQRDVEIKDDKPVREYYQLAIAEGEAVAHCPETVTELAKPNWFAGHKINNLILVLFCSGFVLFFIHRAGKNPNLFIRKLSGLEAIDEAIGRATEMGKPILYTTGYSDMDQVSTIASVNILAHVSRKVADYDSRLLVPCKWSIAMTVCQEVVKESYLNAGRPDAYNPQEIYFIAGEQFSYTAAVDGLLVREKPAAIFLLGTFAAEALILAETGASTGAIQISGTDSAYQIPFFVVACDYCLIGEELYAASAYLSREPKLLGSLKGQDAGKLLLIAGLLLGNLCMLMQFGLGQMIAAPLVLAIKRFFTPL